MSSIADLTPGTWNVDASHSSVNFVVRHLMVSKVRGHFEKFEGTLTIAEDPLQSTVAATVEVDSVTTNDEGRDGHLKGADFFEAGTHSQITLTSTSITPKGSDYLLVGDLTIRGVTKSVTFDLEFDGVSPDPWGGTRAGFSAETEISRKDFGMEWNAAIEAGGVVVGDKVKIQLDIEAVKAA